MESKLNRTNPRRAGALLLLLALAALCAAACANPATTAGSIPLPQAGVVASAPPSAVLEIGAARLEISPFKSTIMGGYGVYFGSIDTCRWSSGVHDPLYATALYATKDGAPLLLIALDLVGLASPDQDDIKRAIAARWAIPAANVIICCSHTHHGPDTMGLWGTTLPPQTGRDEDYMLYLKSQVVQVAGLAFQARRPARLALAVGELAGPHWNDYQDTVENAPIDHTMTVVQATDERGAPIVTLLNWGCHPTTENGKNLLISSDWVGAYYREIAADDVGIPLFVNGSIGASIQPSEPWREEHVGTEEQGQGFVWADAFGRAVAERTRLLLAELEPLEVERIEVRNAVVATTLENRLFSLARALGVLSFDLPALHQPLNTRITQASLGELRLATVPGELSPQLGMLIREAVGGRAQIICGLSQDYFGYIIDSEQYADDRLKYERMLCISPELGLSLVRAHRELAGR